MGLDGLTARDSFKIQPIVAHIESVCIDVLERIIADPTPPITISLPKSNSRNFKFNTHLAKTSAYNSTFLQQFVRILRDRANKVASSYI